MPKCVMCNMEVEESVMGEGELCKNCLRRQALPPRTEPLRPRVPCFRCNGTSFVRCRAIRERAATGSDYVREYIAPLSLTFRLSRRERGIITTRIEYNADTDNPSGLLEAYACRKCGYVEFYTFQPQDIPIHEALGTELFEVGGDKPYR